MLWIARSKTVNVITTNCLFDATNDHNGLPWISVDRYSPSSLISDGFFNLHLIYEGATELFVVMNPSRGHFKVSITALKRWSKCERSLSVAFQWYRIHSWWSMHEYFWAAVKFKKRAHQFRSAYVWSYHFIWDNVGIYTAPYDARTNASVWGLKWELDSDIIWHLELTGCRQQEESDSPVTPASPGFFFFYSAPFSLRIYSFVISLLFFLKLLSWEKKRFLANAWIPVTVCGVITIKINEWKARWVAL